ncbi:MAG: hypothetical protein ACYDIA_18930 [Candidatus Humimicrobiaceae bacterium]
MDKRTKKESAKYIALDMIKPTSFYSHETEKTKLTWFLYDLSMGIYDNVREKLGKELKKYAIHEEDMAKFSIYFAKLTKNIILQKLRGQIDMVYFSHQNIEPYFPQLSNSLINRMLEAIAEAWDGQLNFCEVCPTRCISEKDRYCTLFDEDYF